MKNVLEFYSNFNNYKENIRIEVWYGENEQWRSHVINYFGKPGEYGMFKVDVEKFFDYVASLIPEMYRTDRIKKWLESAPTIVEAEDSE